jgi:hypothetical protein
MAHYGSAQYSRSLRDFIALGAVDDWTAIHKFGRNDDLGASVEDIWAVGGVYTYLTAATQMEIVSTVTTDGVAGDGCRSVVIQGLDADFLEISETLATNGTTAVPTVNSYIRINRMYCLDTGVYGGSNLGDLTLRTVSGGASHALISYASGGANWAEGQTQLGRYCVPAGKVGFITSLEVGIDSGKGADIQIYQRQNADNVAAPFCSKRLVKSMDGVVGDFTMNFDGPLIFPAMTDIITRARLTSGANGRIHISYDIFIGVQ